MKERALGFLERNARHLKEARLQTTLASVNVGPGRTYTCEILLERETVYRPLNPRFSDQLLSTVAD